jgi:hypothetical protein
MMTPRAPPEAGFADYLAPGPVAVLGLTAAGALRIRELLPRRIHLEAIPGIS